MVSENRLRKYARLGVVMGVNLQKNQTLIVNASVEIKDFVRLVVEEAYKAGAKKVIVNWSDDYINRMHYEGQDVETLCAIEDYQVEAKVKPLREGGAVLSLTSPVPGIMAGVPAEKMGKASIAMQTAFKESSELTMANKARWSVLGVPNVAWAKKVFPNVSVEEAMEALWENILNTCYVQEENDPVKEWEKHNHDLMHRTAILNDFNFKALHFKNEEGTDLTIELVKDHIWAGGCEEAKDEVIFNPNMPTEEIFSMPSKYGVNGTVVSTKPLNYNGNLISKFTLHFENGAVTSYSAEDNYDTLKSLIEFDEGSKYIGEVALVEDGSPISQSNILFFNTLYDENASCHLALGQAYPMNVKGGTEMSKEELKEAGANDSMTHVDFMFGSSSMKITGITFDGKEVPVFENGNFVF